MDESGSLLFPEQEISSPSPQTELNEPSPQSELPSLPRPAEEYFVERRGSAEDGGEKKKGTARRLIRYVAATAAAVGLLAGTAPAPAPEPTPAPAIEYVDAESNAVIEFAVVLPDDPETLRFVAHGFLFTPEAVDVGVEYYLVAPDGTETALPRYAEIDTQYTRDCYFRKGDVSTPDSNRVFKLFSCGEDDSCREDPGWESYATIGIPVDRLSVGEVAEGSSFKVVETYRIGDVWYRETIARRIGLLSSEPEISVSLETEPLGDGFSQAHFRAVVHPREGDDHEYFFGDPAEYWESNPIPSFCVRWYDADRNFLHEGWERVAPLSVQPWPYPAVKRAGRDFIIEYDGPVQSASPNEDAAYYSLELTVTDMSTGWRYLIETELEKNVLFPQG